MSNKYIFPSLSLVSPPVLVRPGEEDEIRSVVELLLTRFEECDMEVTLGNIYVGSATMRVEIIPGPGVRVDRVMAMENDLALATSSPFARIVMVPHVGALGVELARPSPQPVRLVNILASKSWAKFTGRIPIALGETDIGEPVVEDLTSWPHLLLGGSTGSGKSNSVDAIILSLVFQKAPSEVRFVMVGAGISTLSVYQRLPHQLCPPINSKAKATGAFESLLNLVESRNALVASYRCNHFESYRKTAENPEPYIVVIIDEIADLLHGSSTRNTELITELLRQGAPAGIHVVATITPRPSADLLPSSLKVNFRARACFSVPSHLDSRTILGIEGADLLDQPGDLLYMGPGCPKPRFIKGVCVADDEVANVTEFFVSNA